MAKKILKKAQKGTTVKPTRDSTGYYRNQAIRATSEQDFAANFGNKTAYSKAVKAEAKANENKARQANKGKPGYDKNGFPLPKIQSGTKGVGKLAAKKNGGSIKRKK
jgi:hypothetical protein